MKCRQNSKNVYTIYVAKSAAIRYNISTEENINILNVKVSVILEGNRFNCLSILQ